MLGPGGDFVVVGRSDSISYLRRRIRRRRAGTFAA
jgi:hypothetical protein